MKKLTILLAAAAFACSAAFAQDTPKIEVTARLLLHLRHATEQQLHQVICFERRRRGFAAYFTKYIGIEGEFEGYGSYNHSVNVPPPYCNGAGCTIIASGNLFTYNVGPIVKYRSKHFEPFVEAMFGGAHSNFYGNLYQHCTTADCVVASKSPSNNAFDFIIGGGIDIPLSPKFAIRPAQFDYILTRFGNDFTHGNNNQSNFRFQAGIEFRM